MKESKPRFELSLEQVQDFDKREKAFRNWARLHPDASIAELQEANKKFTPTDPKEAEAYKWWCVQEIGRELKLDMPDKSDPNSNRGRF